MSSIGRVGEPSIDATWINVPATPGSIDILRSVTAVIAGHTSLGFDRVDDLRLAVSEGAGRLIRASEHRGSIRVSFSVDDGGLAIHLALRDATVPRWPLGPDVDPLSWIVIETLTDEAEESVDGTDPSIGIRIGFHR
jgi:serine/threonine-protein kinase RsbW